MYKVCDREDKDREDEVIDTFETLDEAVTFAKEWAEDYGHCTVETATGEVVAHIYPAISFEDAWNQSVDFEGMPSRVYNEGEISMMEFIGDDYFRFIAEDGTRYVKVKESPDSDHYTIKIEEK